MLYPSELQAHGAARTGAEHQTCSLVHENGQDWDWGEKNWGRLRENPKVCEDIDLLHHSGNLPLTESLKWVQHSMRAI